MNDDYESVGTETRFAAEGYVIALLDRTTGLTNKLTNEFPVARAYACDVRDPADDMGASAAPSLRCLPSQTTKIMRPLLCLAQCPKFGVEIIPLWVKSDLAQRILEETAAQNSL